MNENTTTAELINQILKRNKIEPISVGSGRENSSRDRDFNLQTTNNKSQTTSQVAVSLRPQNLKEGKTRATPPDLLERQSQKPQASYVGSPAESIHDSISGILVQKIKPKGKPNESLSFYLTMQFNHQIATFDADKYSVWLKPRSRGREFSPETPFEQQIYDLTVEHKEWYLGRCTERGPGGQIVEGIAVTFDPTAKVPHLVLWFDDYSPCIEVPVNNGILTSKQSTSFESTGHWGNKVVLQDTVRPRIGQSRSTVRGGNK